MADINALLGKGSEFEGKLTFEGTVRIDGRFTGEVMSEGKLIVGEGAEIQAEIRVASVEVYGDVTGNIYATEGVELYAPASLRGNITSPALHIDKGVFFEGACQMASQPQRTAAPAQPRREAPPAPAPRVAADDGAATRAISGLYANEGATRQSELKHSF
ncbi:MAG: polymer-forming cytoskeletal protein [Deltaproteobacteria bacterium]|nr:polymer-forming cytoskeletal protein [Deltaproteobacteria bacterium]